MRKSDALVLIENFLLELKVTQTAAARIAGEMLLGYTEFSEPENPLARAILSQNEDLLLAQGQVIESVALLLNQMNQKDPVPAALWELGRLHRANFADVRTQGVALAALGCLPNLEARQSWVKTQLSLKIRQALSGISYEDTESLIAALLLTTAGFNVFATLEAVSDDKVFGFVHNFFHYKDEGLVVVNRWLTLNGHKEVTSWQQLREAAKEIFPSIGTVSYRNLLVARIIDHQFKAYYRLDEAKSLLG